MPIKLTSVTDYDTRYFKLFLEVKKMINNEQLENNLVIPKFSLLH